MKKYLIYGFLDENNNVYYIGKTCNFNDRKKRHLSAIRNMNQFPKYRKARKLIKLGYEFNMKTIEDCISEEEINNKEKYYIDKFKKEGYKLCNLTEGGDGFTSESVKRLFKEGRLIPGMLNKHHTEETKKKISESNKGRPKSEEHKLALKLNHKGMLGKYCTEEHKKNIGLANSLKNITKFRR